MTAQSFTGPNLVIFGWRYYSWLVISEGSNINLLERNRVAKFKHAHQFARLDGRNIKYIIAAAYDAHCSKYIAGTSSKLEGAVNDQDELYLVPSTVIAARRNREPDPDSVVRGVESTESESRKDARPAWG